MSSTLLVLYGVIRLLSVLLAGIFGYWAIFRTEMRSKRWFGLLMFGVALWALFAATHLVVATRSVLVFLTVLSLVLGVTAPLLWVIFTADYTYRSIHNNPIIYAFGGVYIVLIATILSTPIHGYYVSFELHQTPFVHVEMISGPARILAIAYTLSGMALGTYYLASLFERGRSNISKPTAILAGAVLFGIVPFAASLLGLVPIPTYDHTPFGISVFILSVGYIVVQYNFYNLSPIAREIVLDEVSDAIIVLDTELRLVDSNSAATEIFPEVNSDSIGVPLTTVDTELTDLIADARDGQENEITISAGDKTRHFLVTISKITRVSEPIGTVLVLRDVTERKERERELETTKMELEQQNERLDSFASVVSHDLRNPLNVAQLRANLIETDDEEHLVELEGALDRIENMIEEMLTFARAGGTINETESVNLRRIASEAWDVAETDGATLETDLDSKNTVESDPELLRNVFENLYRNACDHKVPPLTVSVGTLNDGTGFYIEDDGDGIPKDERERVFEHGYASDGEGTGFGLSIVTDIVEGHDWEIAVTDSSIGGARFEIYTE